MFIVPIEYKIVELHQNSVFAGKLGQRISEEIVVARGDMRILVKVAGSYHTMAVRPGSRLHVGDTITIRGSVSGGETTVARERIRKA